MQPDAYLEWPSTVGGAATIDFGEDLSCCRNRVTCSGWIIERRTEDRHEPVAKKLVDEAAVAIDRFDHKGEDAVEKRHDILRPPRACICREVADIEKHHADFAQFAPDLRRACQQALDDRRRDMLAEEIGHSLAQRRRLDG